MPGSFHLLAIALSLAPCLMLAPCLSHAAEAPTGRTLRVGAAQSYKSPSAAAAVAQDGDTIEIEAATYRGDVAVWSANRLVIRGVNGIAHLDARGKSAQQKAIWVIRGADTTVEHVEFSGCRVPDKNGAGIRHEGRGLVVRHCRFHDNENGILTGADPESDVLVEQSEFHHNGAGDGYSHNLYIGQIRTFTLRFCSSHHARTGHLVKSRAQANSILSNRLMDEGDGTSSYVIDLPHGGRSMIVGNIIQHGPRAENGLAVSYAAEGAKNRVQELFVVNNTCVNERARAGSFVRVAGNPVVRVVNNIVVGTTTVLTGGGETTNNLVGPNPGFVDAARYDYRLTRHSKAIGAGVDPGRAGDIPLEPRYYYRDPVACTPRPAGETLNIGACPVGGE